MGNAEVAYFDIDPGYTISRDNEHYYLDINIDTLWFSFLKQNGRFFLIKVMVFPALFIAPDKYIELCRSN